MPRVFIIWPMMHSDQLVQPFHQELEQPNHREQDYSMGCNNIYLCRCIRTGRWGHMHCPQHNNPISLLRPA